jgi:hypothetical protein
MVDHRIPPSCADCFEIWKPHPPETPRICPGLHRDCFTFNGSTNTSMQYAVWEFVLYKLAWKNWESGNSDISRGTLYDHKNVLLLQVLLTANGFIAGGSVLQCMTGQYNTVRDNTIPYGTIQYSTGQYNTIQYHTSHITYDNQGNSKYAKLQGKIKNTYYTL